VATAGIHEDQVDATLTTRDGKVHHLFIKHAIGSLGRPLTDAELDAKVADLCEPVIGKARTKALIAAARGVGSAPDLSAVIKAAIPSR